MYMRLVVEKDVPEVVNLYNEARQYAAEVGYIDWPEFTTHNVHELMANNELYCFELNGQVCSAIKLSRDADVRIWGEDKTPAVYASRFAGSSAIHGTNFRDEIVVPALTNYAAEVGRIRGDCLADNERLKNLYRGLGMVCLGDESFFSEKQDRYLTVTKLEYWID